MGPLAAALLENRPAGKSALDLLDLICEPWRGCDAEFEAVDPNHPGRIHPDYQDYRDPRAPLGRLMVEAFAPNGLDDLDLYTKRYESMDGSEDDFDAWWDDIVQPFDQRYGFW